MFGVVSFHFISVFLFPLPPLVVVGKMLLDEKEEDAEAHEGEKEALWRRIQVLIMIMGIFFFFVLEI